MAESNFPKELFISYGRSPEVNTFVSKLRMDLEQNGFSVWLDSQDIQLGSDWHNAIGGGLYNCSAILPIITNKYLTSSYCIKELYTADGDRKLIFPIMFEDVDFDQNESSRGVKFTISHINWTMCRPGKDDYNYNISRLMKNLREKGLGKGDYKGPAKDIRLGEQISSVSEDTVGPSNTSEPILVIPDVAMGGGIATGQDGIMVYTDYTGHKVTIMEGETVLKTFGEQGVMEKNQIMLPAGVAINKDGNILVASQFFLKKFNLEGELLEQVGKLTEPDGDSTFMGPAGITIGAEGRIYVVETGKNRVKVFNPDMTFHSQFSQGDKKLGPGHLNNPMDIASDSKGQLYVADLTNNVVQVFSPDGEFLFRFGKQGHTLGCLQSPMAVAVDSQDYVYVAGGTCTISIYKINGTEAKFIKAFGSYGAEQGQFGGIRALHVDRNGRVYVSETINKRIQVFE